MQYLNSNTLWSLTVGIPLAFASSQGPIERPNMAQIIDANNTPPQSSDDAEWEELDRSAMSADRIDAINEYLRSTGQASA
jgi:hypothetical protein